MKTSILPIDNHPGVHHNLRIVLEAEENFNVVDAVREVMSGRRYTNPQLPNNPHD